jgi:hypothetical protein
MKYVMNNIETMNAYYKDYPKQDSDEEPKDTHNALDNISEKALENALEKALDIRKFEIELYWKRAGYFWLFIASVFTSYFMVITNKRIEIKNELALLLSGLGIFLSVCWFFVNKASKYWQENWEKHVDMLEDNIMGSLYKTTFEYKDKKSDFIHPLRPYNYSVSKINQFLSFVVIFVWIFLFLSNIPAIFCLFKPIRCFYAIIITIALIASIIILCNSCRPSKTREEFYFRRHKVVD